MLLPKKINPDNLIETIVEIRMNPICPPELWAGMISSNIHKLGYTYVPSPQLSVRLDKHGKMAVSVGKGIESTTYGIFIKEHIRFVMQENCLSFNCNMGHYVGWNVYQKEIRDVIKALQDCGIARDFNRVQIRYISEYRNIDLTDKIRGNIDIGSGLFTCHEIKLNRTDGNMKVFISIINKAKRKSADGEVHESSLFDVNVFENFQASSSVEFVSELLNKIHKIEKESFFGLLTNEFIESLNPVY